MKIVESKKHPVYTNYTGFASGVIVGARGKALKQEITKRGYLRVTLCKDGKPFRISSHRFIAGLFIPSPLNKAQINHKDGVKDNNVVSNLEWVTSQENVAHCLKTGLQKVQGASNAAAKLTEKQALAIKYSKVSTTVLAKKYNVSRTIIKMIRSKRLWKHLA